MITSELQTMHVLYKIEDTNTIVVVEDAGHFKVRR